MRDRARLLAQGLLVPFAPRRPSRPRTEPDWQMGVREWAGRVDAILAAIHGPITTRGGQNPQCPRALIGGLHVLAILLHPAQPEWACWAAKAGSRCTRQPNYRHSTPIHRHPSPFQPTEEEAAGDLLPLGKNSHTCRTLSTGHNAATCLASSCPIGALTTKAQWPTMSLMLSPIHILC